MKIDLISIGAAPRPHWQSGSVHCCDASPAELARTVAAVLAHTAADALLFWDGALPLPSAGQLTKLLSSPGQVWHGGLKLGLQGLPHSIDFVSPTWMFNADVDPNLESTSWRLSLRACLVRTEVLRHCGGPSGAFDSIEGSGLELGHRLIKAGVIVRFVPALLSGAPRAAARLSLHDEILFLRLRFGRFWNAWALTRMLLRGDANPLSLAGALRRASFAEPFRGVNPFPHGEPARHAVSGRVTVLIPTVNRYPYLQTVLGQVAAQTVRPEEVIVVDQTDAEHRRPGIGDACPGVPVRVLTLDPPGQCRARNLGLNHASGDYILFIDDDDEIGPDLIEVHLRNLERYGADVSAGVADEAGAGPLPLEFTWLRMSDVFPTNNCMIRRSLLERTGLFDLAYDRGQRADGDLGMRAYLSGAVMILNPRISVFHHHAPVGGLRAHKARRITYASSRKSLVQRHLPSKTECYLWRRFFTERQRTEELWMRAFGTLAARGGMARRVAKAAVGIVMLPHTWWRIRQTSADAGEMLKDYPSIPAAQRAAASHSQR